MAYGEHGSFQGLMTEKNKHHQESLFCRKQLTSPEEPKALCMRCS